MYGCQPACDQPATQTVTYTVPCYGQMTAAVCARHVGPTKARAYPSECTVTPA